MTVDCNYLRVVHLAEHPDLKRIVLAERLKYPGAAVVDQLQDLHWQCGSAPAPALHYGFFE
jgi:hypothetical protein